MFQGYRSNDAVITICQDNKRRSIDIHEMNEPAEVVLGRDTSALKGKPLNEFLPERIRTLLEEYVEFEEDGNDVGSVLSKVQSFCLVNSQGKESAWRLKVLRSEALDHNSYFDLILQDRTGGRKDEAFRSILRENFKGHEVLDTNTGLPDRQSIVKDLELVLYYVNKEAVKACFAVLELDQFHEIQQQYGQTTCYELLKHIAGIAKQNLRGDDTAGCVGPKHLGIILMDTNIESCRMVLNRLRWMISANPYVMDNKEPLPATVSICFTAVGQREMDKDLLPQVENYLLSLPNRTGNALVELP